MIENAEDETRTRLISTEDNIFGLSDKKPVFPHHNLGQKKNHKECNIRTKKSRRNDATYLSDI